MISLLAMKGKSLLSLTVFVVAGSRFVLGRA